MAAIVSHGLWIHPRFVTFFRNFTDAPQAEILKTVFGERRRCARTTPGDGLRDHGVTHMYEVEANSLTEPLEQIPLSARPAFAELRGQIIARTVLPWSEHCTECAWPTCYTTCDLYAPREDGRCRRFVDGMVRIECPDSVNGYLVKIRFKRWGKLWTPGSLKMKSIDDALKQERRDYRVGTILHQVSLPAPVKRFAVTKRYSFKKRVAGRRGHSETKPTCLVLECVNPSEQTVSLTLSLREVGSTNPMPYQRKIELAPGFNRTRIEMSEITRVVNLGGLFGLELVPNETDEETTLYFGLMDFVEEIKQPVKTSSKVKCVVWDLDNTIWDGVLVEDGAPNLRLKPGIAEVIDTLDRRGILQSVASKNNAEEALQVLREFHLADYFLHPHVSWGPKSSSIKSIAERLNIGTNTLLFVDDSPFERSQVMAMFPEVEALDATEYLGILDLARCQVPITEESKARRKMYQTEQGRQAIAETFGEDYQAFLKDCEIEITLSSLMAENMERVHELTQRTNQMNFSGKRYERSMLQDIQKSSYLDTYVISCKDRFGSYGIVGFGIVDSREPRLTDLMFSCRVQAKRVEHAFLNHVIQEYRNLADKDFYASYKKSPRNLPSGKVFEDIGMREVGTADGVTDLVMRRGVEVQDDRVIRVIVQKDNSTRSVI
jgi:FkbH-like protein